MVDKADFYYKGKPMPKDLPSWFTSIRLSTPELPHLKTYKSPRSNELSVRFSNELSEAKINGEQHW